MNPPTHHPTATRRHQPRHSATRRLALACCLVWLAFPASGQIVLEAENGTLAGVTVSTAVPGYSGTGYITGFDNTGDAVSWNFNASHGLYRLTIRFRSPFGQKGFDATVNVSSRWTTWGTS